MGTDAHMLEKPEGAATPRAMPPELRARAANVPGFMPVAEGLALYEAAWTAVSHGPVVEIGTFCGKSTVYLGAAARARHGLVVTVDHHRGSEEHQLGGDYHDPALVDPVSGRIDTLPTLRRTIADAGLESVVIVVVGGSEAVASVCGQRPGMVFIDGGHSEEAAQADYIAWAPRVVPGGLLAVHDVFPDPAEGGQAPYHTCLRALDDGFGEIRRVGSLVILRRPA